MSTEENKVLARRFLEAQAKADIETLEELMAANFVDRSVLPGQGSSREDSTFSNSSFSVESQIAEGDVVASRFTGSSVHTGAFLGVDPTGEEKAYTGMTFHRIVAGKIAEE